MTDDLSNEYEGNWTAEEETAEILADPEAMAAIEEYESEDGGLRVPKDGDDPIANAIREGLAEATPDPRDTDGQPGSNLYFLVDDATGEVLDSFRRDVPFGFELKEGQSVVDSIDYTTHRED